MPIQGVDLYTDRSSLLGILNDGKLFNTSSVFADRKSGAAGGADSGAGVTSPFANQTFATQGVTTTSTVSGSANLSFDASKFVITTRKTTEPRFGYLDYNTYNVTNEEPNRLLKRTEVIRGELGRLLPSNVFLDIIGLAGGISQESSLNFESGDGGTYGVLLVSVSSNTEFGQPNGVLTLQNRGDALRNFALSGGVVWVRYEHKTAGDRPLASVVNQELLKHFGTSMFYNDTTFPPPPANPRVSNSLLFTEGAAYLPGEFETGATDTITNGTPLYGSADNIVAAFEPVGDGYLVLTGDSNGTSNTDTLPSAESTELKEAWILGLRSLNLNL